MIIAAADAIEARGFDIGRQLCVDATDISPTCFKMTYLQASLRGIPATVRRGNTLSGEVFDLATTPSFAGFYATHRERFDDWASGPHDHDAELSGEAAQTAAREPEPTPDRPLARPTVQPQRRHAHQFDLFAPDSDPS